VQHGDEGIPANNKDGASHPSGSSNPTQSVCASSRAFLRIGASRSIRFALDRWAPTLFLKIARAYQRAIEHETIKILIPLTVGVEVPRRTNARSVFIACRTRSLAISGM
jgi:hypothetical protein